MKLKVKVDDCFYDVEIEDLSKRPILATVENETFEVWPEAIAQYTTSQSTTVAASLPEIKKSHPTPKTDVIISPQPISEPIRKSVLAPIPGVITAISIHPGDEVKAGQELCKLEAMKMNNSIRAPRAGRICSIHISVGQQVKHQELLMEFDE